MEDWIREIVEQICIAEILRDSKLDSGNRLALISVDNGVEFALKFYASYNRKLKPSELNSNDAFFRVIDLVTPSLITDIQSKDLRQFHEHRNILYHGSKLTTVNPNLVTRYIALSKALIFKLFDYQITTQNWAVLLSGTKKSIVKEHSILEPVIYEDGIVDNCRVLRMIVPSQPKNTETIRLLIHGFYSKYARGPTEEELEKSLNISMHHIPRESLRVQIAQLRRQRKIERDSLSVTPSGVAELRKKFLV